MASSRTQKSDQASIVAAIESQERLDLCSDLDCANVCRDEYCSRVEIHTAHVSKRSAAGRAPRTCPACFASIPKGQGAHCTTCGWRRGGVANERRTTCAK